MDPIVDVRNHQPVREADRRHRQGAAALRAARSVEAAAHARGLSRYTYTDLLRLERVLALKGLGLSLKQIAALARDGSRVSGVMARQRELLDERRRRIDRALRAIETIAEAEQPPDALEKFVSESSWDRWESRRQEFLPPVPRAPDRASPSRVALFKKIHDALERDPRGRRARALVKKWDALLKREAGGYEGMADSKRQRWAGRQQWPGGMRQYVASLYDVEPAVWEQVAAFIDQQADRTQG